MKIAQILENQDLEMSEYLRKRVKYVLKQFVNELAHDIYFGLAEHYQEVRQENPEFYRDVSFEDFAGDMGDFVQDQIDEALDPIKDQIHEEIAHLIATKKGATR